MLELGYTGWPSRDILALREAGQVCRRVTELDIPAASWRAEIRDGARREGIRIRTFLIPSIRNVPVCGEPTHDEPDPHHQIVCAVRTDAAPEGRTDRMWWRRVDDLPVTIETWRAMLRCTARRERIAIRTFLHPPGGDEAGDLTGQLVYGMWINQPVAPPTTPSTAPATR